MTRNALIFLCFFLLTKTFLMAQADTGMVVPARIVEGDTLPFLELKSVMVFPPFESKYTKSPVRYDKLVRNVKKVYPYAKLAGEKFQDYERILDSLPNEKARKEYMKRAEKELEDQFGKEIRDLTFSQGKVLIKLIYRQTGNSSYELVRELRGKFSAFVWQTLARIFGYDLKTMYNPSEDANDAAIERIVLLIEAGEL